MNEEINVYIMNKDKEAIEWIRNMSKDIKNPLYLAWPILEKYYIKCINDLKNNPNLQFDEKGHGSKEEIYISVQNYLKNNNFIEECAKFFNCSKEEVINIINDENENVRDKNYIIVNRLYNMWLKLGHTARITFFANEELESMLGDHNREEYTLLTSTVLLSALLHDIGRFYQAAKFNTLSDNVVYDQDLGMKLDHAIAGYYYSIATSFNLHKRFDGQDKNEDINRFIEDVISAVIVRYHQKSNNRVTQFDYTGDIENLSDYNEEFTKEMFNFILESNNESKNIIGLPVKFNEEHKKFIDNFINQIFSKKNINREMTGGFGEDQPAKELEESIALNTEKIIKKTKKITIEELSEKIVDVVDDGLKIFYERKGIENIDGLTEEERNSYKKIIIDNLQDMLNYDIAETISEKLKINPKETNLVKTFISKVFTITTDADKVDILNQRILGLFNSFKKMNTYEIYPPKGMSLKEMLSKYFKQQIKEESLIIDKNLINILNRLSKTVRTGLKNTIFRGLNVFEENSDVKFKETIEMNELIERAFKTLLDSDYLELLQNQGIIDRITDYNQFKEDNLRLLQIQISTEQLLNNLPDDESKYKHLENLVLTPEMIRCYKEEDISEAKDGLQKRWILLANDAEHVCPSSIGGLLFQLNQFLFVNMRNLKSFQYIKESGMLDTLLKSYNDCQIEYNIIKNRIEDAKKFVDRVIDYCTKNSKTYISNEELEKLRKNSGLEDMFIEQSSNNLNRSNRIR